MIQCQKLLLFQSLWRLSVSRRNPTGDLCQYRSLRLWVRWRILFPNVRVGQGFYKKTLCTRTKETRQCRWMSPAPLDSGWPPDHDYDWITLLINDKCFQPQCDKDHQARKDKEINIDNFKNFHARRRWKHSMKVVALCNKLSRSRSSKLGQEDPEDQAVQQPPVVSNMTTGKTAEVREQ